MSWIPDHDKDKLKLLGEIQAELWEFYSLNDLTQLKTLLCERRRLANTRSWLKEHGKTGKSLAGIDESLIQNTKNISEIVSQDFDV